MHGACVSRHSNRTQTIWAKISLICMARKLQIWLKETKGICIEGNSIQGRWEKRDRMAMAMVSVLNHTSRTVEAGRGVYISEGIWDGQYKEVTRVTQVARATRRLTGAISSLSAIKQNVSGSGTRQTQGNTANFWIKRACSKNQFSQRAGAERSKARPTRGFVGRVGINE